MRLDYAPPVGRHQRAGRVRRGARVGPPERQQLMQAGRGVAHVGAGVGALVAEHLRRRLVDQPDAVLRVDHQDALAQVLDDVLRELRQVLEVDFLSPDDGLAFAQPARQQPRAERDQEGAGAEHARGRVVRGGRVAIGLAGDLLQQQHQAGDRREQEGVAVLGEQRGRADRQHEQDADAAGDATARVEQQRDRQRVDQAVRDRDLPQGEPAETLHQHEDHAGGQVDHGGGEEQCGVDGPERGVWLRQPADAEQRDRNQQPVGVDEPDDPQREVARGGRQALYGGRHRPR